MTTHPLVLWFTQLVDSWNAAGWGEYLLFETVEGLRDRPFKFLDPLSQEDLQKLRMLRDELQLWPFWDATIPGWDTVAIKAWRVHATTTTAKAIRDGMS